MCPAPAHGPEWKQAWMLDGHAAAHAERVTGWAVAIMEAQYRLHRSPM